MRAKQFMFICAGVLMLAAAYQLGVQRAEAQLGGAFTGINVNESGDVTTAITSTGDVYARGGFPQCSTNDFTTMIWANVGCGTWQYMGNVMDGVTVNAEPTTATDVKLKYREE